MATKIAQQHNVFPDGRVVDLEFFDDSSVTGTTRFPDGKQIAEAIYPPSPEPAS